MFEVHTADTAARNRPTLLALPLEIREEIYKHLLVYECPMTIRRRKNCPKIFLTSRQLYSEATRYFFSKNVVLLNVDYLSAASGRLNCGFQAYAGKVSRLRMDFTTAYEQRRVGAPCYRERIDFIARTLMREKGEKEERGPLLLKELIITYRKLGHISYGWDLGYLAPFSQLKGRIGKLSLSHGPETCFEGLQSEFDKIEELLMPQTTTKQRII